MQRSKAEELHSRNKVRNGKDWTRADKKSEKVVSKHRDGHLDENSD
jgi:hypothetical protein